MIENIEDHERLINSMKLLNERYYTKPEYNHFLLFGSPWDEVNLHSQFLFFLLNPRGTHNLGDSFIKLFLEQVGVTTFDLTDCRTFKESDYIDIHIKNNQKHSIIIENKINAGDQYKQLYTYITLLEDKGEKVFPFYLTIDEHEPSKESIEGLNDIQKNEIKCISYKNHIREFIKKAIEKAATKPALRESLVQYLEIIDLITGTNPNTKYMEKLKELLLTGKNLLIANDINNAIQGCYAEQIFKIWTKIDNEFKKYPDIYLGKQSKKTCTLANVERYLTDPSRRYGHGYIFEINNIEIIVEMCEGIEWSLFKIDQERYINSIKRADLKLTGRRDNRFYVANPKFDMRFPLSKEALECLIDEHKMQKYAELVVAKVMNLYEAYITEQ